MRPLHPFLYFTPALLLKKVIDDVLRQDHVQARANFSLRDACLLIVHLLLAGVRVRLHVIYDGGFGRSLALIVRRRLLTVMDDHGGGSDGQARHSRALFEALAA